MGADKAVYILSIDDARGSRRKSQVVINDIPPRSLSIICGAASN